MLKLFVVGSKSPDPSKWSIWDEVTVVIAKDKKEALKLAKAVSGIPSLEEFCTEIPMDKALVLRTDNEPAYGDDI